MLKYNSAIIVPDGSATICVIRKYASQNDNPKKVASSLILVCVVVYIYIYIYIYIYNYMYAVT